VQLSEDIQRGLAPLRGVFGVFARNLENDDVSEVNADEVLPTESAAKSWILIHYSRGVVAGKYDPDARVIVPDDFRVGGTGVIRYLSGGLSVSLEDLAWLMTIVSDNVATSLLLLQIGGPEEVNRTMADLGLSTARLATFEQMGAGEPFGTASPRHLAEAYAHLDQPCREKLFRQQDLIGLPRRLDHNAYASDLGAPRPVRVFNKTGVGPTTFIDSGLFETDSGRWVVAAMASELPERTSRPGDPVPVAFGEIGLVFYRSWGRIRG
jgi:beta-lactamase class A